jgi:hypothetical protein
MAIRPSIRASSAPTNDQNSGEWQNRRKARYVSLRAYCPGQRVNEDALPP